MLPALRLTSPIRWFRHALAVLLGGAVVVASSGCGDDLRACVTETDMKTFTLYTCAELEPKQTCDSGSFYTAQLFEEKSCADVGYPHLCNAEQTEEYGLAGGPSFVSNSDCNPRKAPAAVGSGSGGGDNGGGSSGLSCETEAWTCANDGQATPTCQWACTFPDGSSERKKTCAVLESMLTDGNPGKCCAVCR